MVTKNHHIVITWQQEHWRLDVIFKQLGNCGLILSIDFNYCLYFLWMTPSIHFLLLYPFRGGGGGCWSPSQFFVPWVSRQFVTWPHLRQTSFLAPIHTYGQFGSPEPPVCVCLWRAGGTVNTQRKTHAGTGRTCQLHTLFALRFRQGAFLLWGSNTNLRYRVSVDPLKVKWD